MLLRAILCCIKVLIFPDTQQGDNKYLFNQFMNKQQKIMGYNLWLLNCHNWAHFLLTWHRILRKGNTCYIFQQERKSFLNWNNLIICLVIASYNSEEHMFYIINRHLFLGISFEQQAEQCLTPCISNPQGATRTAWAKPRSFSQVTGSVICHSPQLSESVRIREKNKTLFIHLSSAFKEHLSLHWCSFWLYWEICC